MLDFDAYAKFSRPGPRYTSYPTALEFSEKFGYEDYINELKSQKNPLSLYFHMPFCKSACYFCGCNVLYTNKEDRLKRYIDFIGEEINLLSNIIDTNKEVIQLHFGGGTPTYFSAKLLDTHLKNIKTHFKNFSPDAEISCEIDPRFLDEEQVDVLISYGFNRISFGQQDFNPSVQKAINRIQPFELTKKAIDLVRKKGIKSVNMDLIYGLPYQNLKTFKNTLELALNLNPDRFAIFNYAHVPWIKKLMQKIDEKKLPTPKEKLEILKFTHDFMLNSGYKMVGMDHYAKEDDELFVSLKNGSLHRNFQGYTTKGGANLIGIGLTSIGEGDRYYAQNLKDIKEYEKSINCGVLPYSKGILLNKEDLLRKDIIMSLMANFRLDIKKIEDKFKIDFFKHFDKNLKNLEYLKDFYSIDENFISVNETGKLLIRNIAMCFDEYLIQGEKKFSKTI